MLDSTKRPRRHTIKLSMQIPKKYLHDRLILLLVTLNAFLAFLCILLVLLRLGSVHGGNGYIVQYRSNLGISAFKTGSISNFFAFVLFAPAVFLINTVLSIRTYALRRELSVTVLGLGALVLILATIVSNALLVLR